MFRKNDFPCNEVMYFSKPHSQNLKMLSTGILGRRVLWTRGSKKACATAPATSSVCALVLIKSRDGNDKKKHAHRQPYAKFYDQRTGNTSEFRGYK